MELIKELKNPLMLFYPKGKHEIQNDEEDISKNVNDSRLFFELKDEQT